jgi:hypothetical protein
MEVLSRRLLGGKDENNEDSVRIAGDPVVIRTRHLPTHEHKAEALPLEPTLYGALSTWIPPRSNREQDKEQTRSK